MTGATTPSGGPLRVVLADRGDPVTGPLSRAMAHRFDVVGRVDAELASWERLVVAGSTFRLRRHTWSERYHKSGLAVSRRSRRADAGVAAIRPPADVILQTHALFEITDRRTVLYLDCTHRQAMEQWPGWNPLRGRALARWLARERRQFHRAAHLFAFCEETARSLRVDYDVPAERVTVVGAGVNFTRLATPPRRHAGAPTVLFVGNDFERKGGPALLDAFAVLRRRVPDARLRLVGDPHPLPATDGVEQLGRVRDRATLSRLYAEADVFCLPARFDPYPGVLLEAMAHGLPCVVTASCGIPEIVDEGVTALVVGRVGTAAPAPTDLAAALERLLLDPDRAGRMGAAGRRRVEEHFSWAHVLDRMQPSLERLAHRADHPAAPPAPPRLPSPTGRS